MERRISLFWPLALIAAGALWILIEMGIVPSSNLWALVYLWPFLLIAAGLGLILRSYWKYSGLLMDMLVISGAFLAVFFAPRLGWTHVPDYMIGGDIFFVGPSERGSGNIITEDRNVQDFNAIQLSYPGQVVIRQGTVESLNIQAEDNVVADIRTQVVNGILGIEAVRDGHLRVVPTKPVKITIVVKDLAELDFESAGEVRVENLKTDALKAMLDGAGTLNFGDLQVKTLSCTLDGAGSINASGTADSVDVRVDGFGSFSGADLHSQTGTIHVDGAGSATVWVDASLTAVINGLGSINYYGDAQVTKSVDGLGSVNHLGKK